MENDMGIGEEIRKIQEYLNQLQPGNTSISFTELMEVLLQGLQGQCFPMLPLHLKEARYRKLPFT